MPTCFEIIIGSLYALTISSALACLAVFIAFRILKKPVSATLKYTIASLLCILLHVINLGFFRYICIIPIMLFGLAFLLINNYCCKYFTPRLKMLNRILYGTYILHNIILPDTNIRGLNYILCGLISHQSIVFEPESEPTLLYLFMDGLMYFLYYFSAVLIVITIVLLITQLVLCSKQKKLQQNT